MLRFIGAALVAGTALIGGAWADDIEPLRQPAFDKCSVGGTESVPQCNCLIDYVATQFGDDAVAMLKILGAGLEPSNIKGIAELLGISEDEAKVVISRLNEKMDGAIGACANAQ